VAAFVSGSHARGTDDPHSDVDLGLITTEGAYNELEAYFKVELVLPTEQLSALDDSICPMDAQAMLIAVQTIGRVYREIAPGLADAHGLPYPLALEHLMLERLGSTRVASSR
jgi:hypothetical protein